MLRHFSEGRERVKRERGEKESVCAREERKRECVRERERGRKKAWVYVCE